MTVKFFGQYLIERGEIDNVQLLEALDLMKTQNRRLGQIAVDEKLISRKDADQLNIKQRAKDMAFGELAVKEKLIDTQQLDRLILLQQDSHIYIGEALVRLGHIDEVSLASLLEDFKRDQAPYEIGAVDLPEDLANNRLAAVILDLLPKFALRIAQVRLKVGDVQRLREVPDFTYRVALQMPGMPGIQVTLMGDDEFARQLSAGAYAVKPEDLTPELVIDGLAEFLNIVAGNTASILERRGVASSVEPPDYAAQPSDGWIFHLAATEGRAALVLAQTHR